MTKTFCCLQSHLPLTVDLNGFHHFGSNNKEQQAVPVVALYSNFTETVSLLKYPFRTKPSTKQQSKMSGPETIPVIVYYTCNVKTQLRQGSVREIIHRMPTKTFVARPFSSTSNCICPPDAFHSLRCAIRICECIAALNIRDKIIHNNLYSYFMILIARHIYLNVVAGYCNNLFTINGGCSAHVPSIINRFASLSCISF